MKKRGLTKRGVAALRSGTHSLESLLADENYSVEITADTKVTQISLSAVAATPEGVAANDEIVDEAEQSDSAATAQDTEQSTEMKTVEQLTAELAESSSSLIAANDNLATAQASLAESEAQNTKLQADLDAQAATEKSYLPVMASAVNSIQMRLSGNVTDVSSMKGPELVQTFTDLSGKFAKAFPTGQVSVVEEDAEQNSAATENVEVLDLFRRTNKLSKGK